MVIADDRLAKERDQDGKDMARAAERFVGIAALANVGRCVMLESYDEGLFQRLHLAMVAVKVRKRWVEMIVGFQGAQNLDRVFGSSFLTGQPDQKPWYTRYLQLLEKSGAAICDDRIFLMREDVGAETVQKVHHLLRCIINANFGRPILKDEFRQWT